MDDDSDREEPDRRAILRRRNRLIALALSGAALGATACDPAPCLEPVFDAGVDAGPTPCLSDAGPPPTDAGDEPPDAGG